MHYKYGAWAAYDAKILVLPKIFAAPSGFLKVVSNSGFCAEPS